VENEGFTSDSKRDSLRQARITSTDSLRTLPDVTYRSSSTDKALEFLAKNPGSIYHADEIAAEIKCPNRETVRQGLCRLVRKGRVERTQKGFYKYCSSPKVGLVDEYIKASRIGIENLRFIKKSVTRGGTGAPRDTVTQHNYDNPVTPAETGVQTVQTVTGQFPDSSIVMKMGYPIQLRTGQEVIWGTDEWGTEIIMFKAGGNGPFSLDLVIFLLERFMLEGLGPEWDRVSIEWNMDSKKFSVAQPVTYQVAYGELLKFYQHNGVARLEGINRTVVGFPDTLMALIEASEKGHGRQALKEVEKMKSRLSQVEKDTRMNNNLVHSLSDRVHGMGKKPVRKERPLV
jgi:hypothetical protein